MRRGLSYYTWLANRKWTFLLQLFLDRGLTSRSDIHFSLQIRLCYQYLIQLIFHASVLTMLGLNGNTSVLLVQIFSQVWTIKNFQGNWFYFFLLHPFVLVNGPQVFYWGRTPTQLLPQFSFRLCKQNYCFNFHNQNNHTSLAILYVYRLKWRWVI